MADVVYLEVRDTIRVEVAGEPELSGTHVVDAKGVELPLLGLVPLHGLTVDQADERLTAAFAEGYLIDPQVEVTLLRRSTWRDVEPYPTALLETAPGVWYTVIAPAPPHVPYASEIAFPTGPEDDEPLVRSVRKYRGTLDTCYEAARKLLPDVDVVTVSALLAPDAAASVEVSPPFADDARFVACLTRKLASWPIEGRLLAPFPFVVTYRQR